MIRTLFTLYCGNNRYFIGISKYSNNEDIIDLTVKQFYRSNLLYYKINIDGNIHFSIVNKIVYNKIIPNKDINNYIIKIRNTYYNSKIFITNNFKMCLNPNKPEFPIKQKQVITKQYNLFTCKRLVICDNVDRKGYIDHIKKQKEPFSLFTQKIF